jgi:hypothetical protein
MTGLGHNRIIIDVDNHFMEVVKFIRDHINQKTGEGSADIETTMKLLMMRGINDLIKGQAKVDKDFAEALSKKVGS